MNMSRAQDNIVLNSMRCPRVWLHPSFQNSFPLASIGMWKPKSDEFHGVIYHCGGRKNLK